MRPLEGMTVIDAAPPLLAARWPPRCSATSVPRSSRSSTPPRAIPTAPTVRARPAWGVVDPARAQQADRRPRPVHPCRSRRAPPAGRDRRRAHRELPPGHARALGGRARAAARGEPSPGHRPGHRVRAEGPYASRPGFGTLAESMSGFAAITGEPDAATLPTVRPRRRHRGADGRRPQSSPRSTTATPRAAPARSSTSRSSSRSSRSSGRSRRSTTSSGIVQQRTGNRSVNNAPRNTYQTRDGRLGRRLDLGAVRRRARHAPRRAPRGVRRAVVRRGIDAGRARRAARRLRRRVDRGARPVREVLEKGRRVRGRGRRDRLDLRRLRRLHRPAVPSPRHHHHDRGPGARRHPHAERPLPDVRDAWRHQVDRAPAGGRHRIRAAAAARTLARGAHRARVSGRHLDRGSEE